MKGPFRFGALPALSLLLFVSPPELRSQPPAAPKAGDRPRAPEQLTRLKEIRAELQQALVDKDEAGIHAAVARLETALGAYAGVPEDRERYSHPAASDPAPPIRDDFSAAFARWRNEGARSALAQRNQLELRVPAYLALACLSAAEAGLPAREDYLRRAAEELDYLVSRQQPDGLFAYPADPGGSAPEAMRAAAQRRAREHPDELRNGFLVRPDPGGGSQFDTGCCSYALASGYEELHDPRYLAAARRAGDWALAQPLAVNWNYNSFSVWQLAKLKEVTGEKAYLDGAWEKARLGVLPGQMDNGRWVDQHNAKRVYHWIMVRNLNELLRALPKDADAHRLIQEHLVKAVDRGAADILRDGVVTTESSVVALSDVLEQFGPNRDWERALLVLVNTLHETRGGSPYAMGAYLHYAAQPPRRTDPSPP